MQRKVKKSSKKIKKSLTWVPLHIFLLPTASFLLNDISHSNLHHRHLLHQTLRSPWPRDSSSPLVLNQTSWLSSSLECWHRPRCAEATPSPNPARKCRRKWRSSFEEGLESLGPVSGRLGCGGGEASRRPESRDGSLGRSRRVWVNNWLNEWVNRSIYKTKLNRCKIVQINYWKKNEINDDIRFDLTNCNERRQCQMAK